MECLLPCMVTLHTVSHIMVGLERMLDYRGIAWISEVSLYYTIDDIRSSMIILRVLYTYHIYSEWVTSCARQKCPLYDRTIVSGVRTKAAIFVAFLGTVTEVM